MSPTATDNIAQRESLGFDGNKRPDAESVEQTVIVARRQRAVGVFAAFPSDSRWAILLVIFDDIKKNSYFE